MEIIHTRTWTHPCWVSVSREDTGDMFVSLRELTSVNKLSSPGASWAVPVARRCNVVEVLDVRGDRIITSHPPLRADVGSSWGSDRRRGRGDSDAGLVGLLLLSPLFNLLRPSPAICCYASGARLYRSTFEDLCRASRQRFSEERETPSRWSGLAQRTQNWVIPRMATKMNDLLSTHFTFCSARVYDIIRSVTVCVACQNNSLVLG